MTSGLYIVATPIGNLGDITLRAIEVLRRCEAVACEDTRVTGKLLAHLGISRPLLRYDDHSDEATRARLLERMRSEAIALTSDAGTPLVSDPGFRLVQGAIEAGIPVTPLPGACAAIAALTVSGLPTDRFLFGGFLPARDKARRALLEELGALRTTLVFYETGPRLVRSLEAIGEVLGNRQVAVARELTKLHEECRRAAPLLLARHYREHPPRGEIVLVIGPPEKPTPPEGDELDAMLLAALGEASPSQAAARVARVTGLERRRLFERAMQLKQQAARRAAGEGGKAR